MKKYLETTKIVLFGIALAIAMTWIVYIAGYLLFTQILPAIFNI